MSWGLTITTTKKADFAAAVDAAAVSPTVLTPEMQEQYELGKTVVKQIAASGVIGDDVLLTASINGHANPGHAPADGWSNDYISLSLYQQKPPTPIVEA